MCQKTRPAEQGRAGLTYLRSHEFWRATKCASSAAIPHLFLAQTVVGDLDMSIQRQQYVVELQIAIDDAVLVEVLECQANLRGIESVPIS